MNGSLCRWSTPQRRPSSSRTARSRWWSPCSWCGPPSSCDGTGSRLPRTLAGLAVALVVVQIALGAANVVAAVGGLRGAAPRRSAPRCSPPAPGYCCALARAGREFAASQPGCWGRATVLGGHAARLRGADQAAHHRAAAGDDRRRPCSSPSAACRRCGSWRRDVGGTLAAGGANAINMCFDRDIDDAHEPHPPRPLPRRGSAPPPWASASRSASSPSPGWRDRSTCFSACWRSVAIGFYVFVYTLWLKRSTPQNIVIGGAAGCVPLLVAGRR